ncbi:hypothetical protein N7528_003608 [Penicillium herquei]|nr:hypothetical protein N7528_003608 [Penicillium herquei]
MAEVDLSALYENASPNEAKALRILDEGLHSSYDNAAAKLTNDLRLYLELANTDGADDSDYLDSPWTMLLAIVHGLPSSEHPWLDVLATAIHGLIQQRGSMADNGPLQLTEFGEHINEASHDLFTDETFKVKAIEILPAEIHSWKMFNSFACRLSTDEHPCLDIELPYVMMTDALENAPGYPTKFDGKVWIAAEWLIRCGNVLYRDLGEIISTEEQAASNIQPGPLAASEGILPISLDRWNFWRSRLIELSRAKPLVGNGVEPLIKKDDQLDKEFVPEEFLLSDTTLSHVKKAVDAMDSVNQKATGVMDLVD